MSIRDEHLKATRRAILNALGDQIAESGTMGFSVKDVAERAGVTHRTVYNHFPTREELNNAFAVHVEDLVGEDGGRPPEFTSIRELPEQLHELYRMLEAHEARLRAYAMLMVATRAQAQVAVDHARQFEGLLQAELGPLPDGEARAVVAALRMFASTIGWHLLTEHHALSSADAASTSAWATRVLLEAVSRGDRPTVESANDTDPVR